MQINTNGVSLEVEVFPATCAAEHDIPILLIMGLGMPRTAWPMPLIDLLTAAGYRVIRFDNRDIGESSKLAQWGKPNVVLATLKHMMGLPVRSRYTLDDMARDTVGLLDALKIKRAHVVGVSMGGMIGQLLAAEHGNRVASFCCVMSSSGARHLPKPTPAARRVLMTRPQGNDPASIVNHYVRVLKVIGSPAYPTPEAQMRERITHHLAPYYFPLGTARQLVAIAANGDRSARLAKIQCPVQIIHGRADPLIPVRAALDLNDKIPGSKLEIIDGMGHDLPLALLPRLADIIVRHTRQIDSMPAPA